MRDDRNAVTMRQKHSGACLQNIWEGEPCDPVATSAQKNARWQMYVLTNRPRQMAISEVAERHRILARHDVSGNWTRETFRPEGTVEPGASPKNVSSLSARL